MWSIRYCRSVEAAAAARSPGPRRLPAAGSEVASSPRPRRQRWSLVPTASARDARARLLCKEENATEGFKVKKGRAGGGAGPPPPRPAPPRPGPPLFFLPRPAPGWGSGGRAGGAVRRWAGGWGAGRVVCHVPGGRSTASAAVPLLCLRHRPSRRPSGHFGRRRSCGPSGGVFGKRWAASAGDSIRHHCPEAKIPASAGITGERPRCSRAWSSTLLLFGH